MNFKESKFKRSTQTNIKIKLPKASEKENYLDNI